MKEANERGTETERSEALQADALEITRKEKKRKDIRMQGTGCFACGSKNLKMLRYSFWQLIASA